VIRITMMMYLRYPLSLRQVEDLLFDRGHRHLPLDDTILVKSPRSNIRQGD
jgi:transposase-like protein